ncbi:MAG: HEPN domain-containing protein [Candidatus Korobacteraceae bacterium]
MADKSNRIHSVFSVVGAFWQPDSPQDIITGTLESDRRYLTLTTAPVYRPELSTEDILNAFNAFNFSKNEILDVVHGFTSDGMCTLCHLIDQKHLGITDMSSRREVAAIRYRLSVCVMGMQLRSMEDRCLDSARYSFSSWNQWLPQYVGETWEKEFVVLKVPLEHRDLVAVELDSKPIKVKLKLGSELKSSGKGGGRVSRSVPFVEVENNEKESLSWYLDVGNRLENLFSLLTGTSLTMQTMFLYRGEESAHVNLKRRDRPGTFDFLDCVHCNPDQIGTAVKIWLGEDERFHPVEGLALGVLRKGKLFVETEFLSLAQALEGFHRATTTTTSPNKAQLRQVRKKISALIQAEEIDNALKVRICESVSYANEPTLASRLADLCRRLTPTALSKMKLDPETFIRDVVDGRNFYTHAGGKLRRNRPVPKPKELFLLNQKMRALLRGVMLLRLQVPEELLFEPLRRQATRWG